MLELRNDAICEFGPDSPMVPQTAFTNVIGTIYGYEYPYAYQIPTMYWQSYPVYIYTDKTAKAIQVLKTLEQEKILKVSSVKQFIALVEKIAGLL